MKNRDVLISKFNKINRLLIYNTTMAFLKRFCIGSFNDSKRIKQLTVISLKLNQLSLIVVFLVCSIFSYGQWTQLNSGTTQDLNELFFPVSDTGYAVGNKGTVLKTTNAGLSWSTLNSGVSVNLHELYFLNSKTGWVVGDSGTVCFTSNGGLTWNHSYIDSAANINLHSVYAINTSSVLVGGSNIFSNSHIYKSNNSGITWQSSYIETYLWNVDILKIGMTSQTKGYALTRGNVLKTNDGGLNWHITDTASVHSFSMFSILEDLAFFPNNDTLFVCGWYPAYFGKSVNGAQNWSHSAAQDYTNLDFINPRIGYVGGWGHMHKTTDGGLSFTDASGGSSALLSNIYSIDFTDEWTGYACGKYGKIIKTSSGQSTSLNKFNEEDSSVLIFPNPSASIVNLSKESNVFVTNTLGEIIIQESKLQSIDLSNQPQGVYLIHILNNRGDVQQRSKLIKID